VDGDVNGGAVGDVFPVIDEYRLDLNEEEIPSPLSFSPLYLSHPFSLLFKYSIYSPSDLISLF